MANDRPLRLLGKLNVYTMATGDGRDIELSVVDDYISWRRVGDAKWTQLVPIADLKGDRALIDEIQESLSRKVEIQSTVRAGNIVVASEEGNLECSGLSCDDILDTLADKAGIIGSIPRDHIAISDGRGNFRDSGILYSDLLKKDEIITGTVTVSKEMTATGYSIIHIPEEVLPYPDITVYHNGMLLIKDIHYVIEDTNIRLLKDTTYKGDIFTFVGYGPLQGAGSGSVVVEGHTHKNKEILDNITQEMINSWNSNTSSNLVEVYKVNGEVIPIKDKVLDIVLPEPEIEESEEIGVADDGSLYIKQVDINKLVSAPSDTLLLNSGGAFDTGIIPGLESLIFNGGDADE